MGCTCVCVYFFCIRLYLRIGTTVYTALILVRVTDGFEWENLKVIFYLFLFFCYSGLNFQDLMVRQGAIDSPPKTPFILGFECSGDIEQVGENVKDFQVSTPPLPSPSPWPQWIGGNWIENERLKRPWSQCSYTYFLRHRWPNNLLYCENLRRFSFQYWTRKAEKLAWPVTYFGRENVLVWAY